VQRKRAEDNQSSSFCQPIFQEFCIQSSEKLAATRDVSQFGLHADAGVEHHRASMVWPALQKKVLHRGGKTVTLRPRG
jgi:hypothetical protein